MDLSSWVSTAPSDGSQIYPTAAFLRQQWRLLDTGMRQSIELPDGTLKPGAAPMTIATESVLSAIQQGAGGNEHAIHAVPYLMSGTTRVVMFRSQTVNGVFATQDHHLIGTHKLIEHNDYTGTKVRTVVSGSSKIASNPAGTVSFQYVWSGNTSISGHRVVFDEPPLVFLSTDEGTTINYEPRLSSVTAGGFQAIMVPLDGTASAVSLHFTAIGVRSLTS